MQNLKQLEEAVNLAVMIAPIVGKSSVTAEEISESVDNILRIPDYEHLDRDSLLIALLHRVVLDIEQPPITIFDPNQPHEDWLAAKRPSLKWKLSQRYFRWLKTVVGRPIKELNTFENSLDSIFERVEDPEKGGKWDRRGLVVGHVQSGKTQHYIGLVNRAVDAGYKIVIVLTGTTENLRTQTQIRFDEGLYGYESDPEIAAGVFKAENRLGVASQAIINASDLEDPDYRVLPLTHRGSRGDWNTTSMNAHPGQILPADPIIFVCKKNGTVLRRLYEWLNNKKLDANTNLQVPLMMIDDEADNASINTRAIKRDPETGERIKQDQQPTVINGRIRSILSIFDKSAFIGYTATPFANFYIPHDKEGKNANDMWNDDLFPRDFISVLGTSNDYIGPETVMGSRYAIEDEEDEGEGLPVDDSGPLKIIRQVHDDDLLKHTKKDFIVEGLPPSLTKAIKTFILSCAARSLRGQSGQHNSMLIHVTRFINVQRQIADQVDTYLTEIRNSLINGAGANPVHIPEFKELWEEDYHPTSQWIKKIRSVDYANLKGLDLSWDSILQELTTVAQTIEVREVNGNRNDAMVYKEHPNGYNVIAVGGDKLNRGLTLEGLTVSYFLRHAGAYDTLLQMGRWFGYRNGYLDLCRLYAPPDLVSDYRHVAQVEEDVRNDLMLMAQQEKSPKDFLLKVMKHPGGLTITANNRMRNGTLMRMSFSGHSAEGLSYSTNPGIIYQNYQRVCQFLEDTNCGLESMETDPAKAGNNYVFTGIDGNKVAKLLYDQSGDELITGPEKGTGIPSHVAAYIRDRINQDNELTDWTVAVINNQAAGSPRDTINGLPIGLTNRKNKSTLPDVYSFGRLINPTDELLDISPGTLSETREMILQRDIKWWNIQKEQWERHRNGSTDQTYQKPEPDISKVSDGRLVPVIRNEVRTPDKGLLILYPLNPTNANKPEGSAPLIGWAVSFPASDGDPDIEFMINKDQLHLIQEEFDYDDPE